VSHGPATASPAMMMSRPGYAGAPIDRGVVTSSPATYVTMPTASTVSRHGDGGGGETRRLTPSGETCTRRSDSSAATADATGTATSIAVYPQTVGVTVNEKYCVPTGAAVARAGRASAKTPV